MLELSILTVMPVDCKVANEFCKYNSVFFSRRSQLPAFIPEWNYEMER
jgi:hypothetical protein